MKVHELVLFEYLLLAHYLQGKHLLPSPELHQLDPSERTVAQSGQHLQVVTLQLTQNLFAVLLESVQLVLLHYNY